MIKIRKFNEQQIGNLNSNFWRWFGSSEVVDKNGEPLVVYHGSNYDDLEEMFDGWFTDDIRVTKEFGSYVYSVYLSIQKALYDDDIESEYENFYEVPYDFEIQTMELRDIVVADNPFTDYLKGKGYDGLITWDDSNVIEGVAYIPFYPTQIKSIYNKGTWNGNVWNMYL